MTEIAGYAGVRALVFGASGFIGRAVVRALERSGAHVVRCVRDAGGAEGSVVADLRVAGAAERVVAEVRPLVTFNLAGYGVDPAERDDAVALRINGDLVKELCYAVSAARDDAWTGQHLVHAGSAQEYGAVSGDLSDPWHCRPTTSYGRTKLAGSEQVVGAVQRGDLRGLSARLFTVYGPGEHAGRLLPSLVAAARGGEDVELTEGLQRRDFTYVGDAAEALVRLGVRNEIVDVGALNVGTGELTSVRSFAETAARVLGIPGERLHFGALPTRDDEQSHDGVSVDRFERLAAWAARTSIEDGVRRTIEEAS